MELTKLSKTDPTALELLRQLKSASNEQEKEKAKQNGKEYIKKMHPETTLQTSNPETGEETTIDAQPEDLAVDQGNNRPDIVAPVHVVQKKEVEAKYDMSEPAFNPRLAKMGITREEELFQMHVLVRKMTREEKIAFLKQEYERLTGQELLSELGRVANEMLNIQREHVQLNVEQNVQEILFNQIAFFCILLSKYQFLNKLMILSLSK